MNKVFALIPVKDRINFTKTCLRSLMDQEYSNHQEIVIDSGSVDGTQTLVNERFPKTILVQGPFDNSWWWTRAMQEGVNVALKLAKPGDFVLGMNNDCVVERDYLTQMVKVAKKNPKSIVGSATYDIKSRELVEMGVKIDWERGKMASIKDPNIKADALSCRGTLFPIETFGEVGNFNVRWLPHYGADYEFMCRVKRRGYKIIVSKKARVYNYTKDTGWENIPAAELGYKQLVELAFSRKSKINLITQLVFTCLCCPIRYLPVNLFRLGLKSLYLLSLTWPWIKLRKR